MKRILVAIDLQDDSNRLIDYAKNLVYELKGELCIVHCETIDRYFSSMMSDTPEFISLEMIEDRKKVIEKKLDNIKNQLEKEDINSTCILMEGPTTDNILSEADKFKADLIIIGSHKHGMFYHLFFGSIHNSLISHSKIPVLVIPATKK